MTTIRTAGQTIESGKGAPEPRVTAAGGRGLSKLRFGTKIAYGMGSMVEGVAAQAVATFLFFYATAICGLPSALAGLALAVGLVVDAIIAPLIGSTSDGWRSRHGRRLPFIVFGFPITAVCLLLIFSLPREMGQTALFLWLSLIASCLRTSISLYLLPYILRLLGLFPFVGDTLVSHLRRRCSQGAHSWPPPRRSTR